MKVTARWLAAPAFALAVWGAGDARAGDIETGNEAESAAPLAAFESLGSDDLAALNGREGVSVLYGEQSFTINNGNNTISADSMRSGTIGLNGSHEGFRGINTMAANTGNGANVQNGLVVNINLH